MSTRAERKARRNATRCRGCGSLDVRHYVPASAWVPGFYLCAWRNDSTTESEEA